MLKFAFGFFVAMIISFLGTGIYLGYYKNVNTSISTPTVKYLLGKEVVGPYHMVNKYIEEVEAFSKEQNIACPKSFGMYYDDPQKKDPEDLKSFVGCVLDEPVSIDNENFISKTLKIEKAYMATFEGSPALGPLKVYPDAKEWFERNKLVFPYALEIYLIRDSSFKTEFIFPIDLNKVVPESLRL